jgi:type IV secretory pathway VirB10-like protein
MRSPWRSHVLGKAAFPHVFDLTNKVCCDSVGTGKVDQHYWRLFGAVFIGGALRGGTQAVMTEAAGAGALGQVAGDIAGNANQVTQQRLGRNLDTRPTIAVEAGNLCQVILIKLLHLPAVARHQCDA